MDLGYFTLLLGLYIFICALLGMDYFSMYLRMHEHYDTDFTPYTRLVVIEPSLRESSPEPRINFDNFGRSFLSVFCLIVNEDWNYSLYIMASVLEPQRSKNAIAYVTVVVLIGNFLLL